ncbi:LAETG motif-containing sortase-dependent surface protein [Streptomyces sp. NPDC002790]|uniref:LAETG motif-containing sortase-dependent surface protein n=1 Tax=Streptomyces sp. NPDC002790 TaxID=3154431 RepID=UPI003316ED5F
MYQRARKRIATVAAASAVFAGGATITTAHAADETPAKNRVLVVVVDFKDVKHSDADAVKENARKEYFGGSQSIAGYYSKVSQGAFTYVPAAKDGVVGPYELDLPQNPCDAGAVRTAAAKAAEADGYTADEDYDSISILQPSAGSDCGWAGLGSVPGPNTWIMVGEDSKISKGAAVHEFGHNQGYSHHERDECPGGDLDSCTTAEGYSSKTPMGGGGPGVGFAAPELISKGWLPGGQAVTVKKSATFTLNSLYGGKTGGARALDIPLGNDRLVVEYRHEDPTNKDDEDGNLDAALEGVYAYLAPEGDYNKSRLLDPTPGEGKGKEDAVSTLTDKKNNVEIEVGRSGGGSATVSVGLDGVPAPDAAGGAKQGNTAAPAPQTQGEEGAPVSEKGSDVGTPAASRQAKDKDLAETGGSSTTPLIAGIGAALACVGGVFLYTVRRRGRRSA